MHAGTRTFVAFSALIATACFTGEAYVGTGTVDGGSADGTAASGGGGGLPSGSPEGGASDTQPPSQAQIEAQTIDRWNAIADHVVGDTYNFHWAPDRFPHPTFAAMGQAEGYREFAAILEQFLAQNFDFLAEYQQFLTPYYYRTTSSSDSDLEVTWDELATDFSTDSYGDVPASIKADLAGDAVRMKPYE